MTERGMRPGSIPLNKLVLVPDLAILATMLGLLLCARGGGAVEVGRELKPLGFGGRGCRSQLLAGGGVGRSAEAFFGAPRWSVTARTWADVGIISKLRTPIVFVGFGSLRPTIDGEYQPPGRRANLEASQLWCSWLPAPRPKWCCPR